ncbi:TFIIA g subfamily [Nucleospora cyclopteri]
MYEIYRTTIIGRSLSEVVDDMIKSGAITPEHGRTILHKFDSVVPKLLEKVTNTLGFKGKILSYNFVDGVWKFLCKDFMMSINNAYFNIPYTRIVACDADTTGENSRRRKKTSNKM